MVPLTGGQLEPIEGLPEPHAISGHVGGRDIARRSLHETTTIVWKGGVPESNVDVMGVAHHRVAVGNSVHHSDSREADRRRKSVEIIVTVHLREAASNEPYLVLIEAAVCVPLGGENPLVSNKVISKRNEASFEHTQSMHCRQLLLHCSSPLTRLSGLESCLFHLRNNRIAGRINVMPICISRREEVDILRVTRWTLPKNKLLRKHGP